MQLVELSRIQVPDNRIRKQFDPEAIEELANSIAEKGLMHPLVVRNDGRTLVAGERRLRAIRRLHDQGRGFACGGKPVPRGFVPVVRLADLDPAAVREAELEENVVRRDLSWQELVAARAELVRLKQAQDPGTTYRDIVREVCHGDNPGMITNFSNAVLLADYLDDEEIASAPSMNEAVKRLRGKLEREFREALVEQTEPGEPPEPGTGAGAVAVALPDHVVFLGDCREILPRLDPDQFDIILTDPPYGIGADKFGSQFSARHTYDDSEENFVSLLEAVLPELDRVAKPKAHLYIFCDVRMWGLLRELVDRLTAFVPWHWPLIWYKGNQGALPDVRWGYRRTYEAVLYAIRGNKPLQRVDHDVLSVQQSGQLLRGAQKPPELYRRLLEASGLPGDSVLDPFAGVGPVFEAAADCRMKATGIELDPAAVGAIIERGAARRG